MESNRLSIYPHCNLMITDTINRQLPVAKTKGINALVLQLPFFITVMLMSRLKFIWKTKIFFYCATPKAVKTREIYATLMQCNEEIRLAARKLIKLQTATVISLSFWGLLACPELYCDWSVHNFHKFHSKLTHVVTLPNFTHDEFLRMTKLDTIFTFNYNYIKFGVLVDIDTTLLDKLNVL